MDRRELIRSIGLGLGYVTLTPAIIISLDSCTSESSWKGTFFTQEESKIITQIVNCIIPKTDIPSGEELGIPQFIDVIVSKLMTYDARELFSNGQSAFIKEIKTDLKKEKLSEIPTNLLLEKLDKYLKGNQEYTMENEKAASYFLQSIRENCIWGYKTNKFIGKNVLSYLPIPGTYKGCVDLMATTKGKSWTE
jgi:hypothetical protein